VVQRTQEAFSQLKAEGQVQRLMGAAAR